MSKANISNTWITGRSVLSTEVVPLYNERINQIKSMGNLLIGLNIIWNSLNMLNHMQVTSLSMLYANQYLYIYIMVQYVL